MRENKAYVPKIVIPASQASELEKRSSDGSKLRDAILGGQDGLVNVLGLVLAVASATNDARVVIIAGLAGLAAESISMAAVAYTSQRAARDFYQRELEREQWEIEHMPEVEREEIRHLYYQKGFRGRELESVVNRITSDKRVWLSVMMSEELKLQREDWDPVSSGLLVGIAAVVGSIIPLLPFFYFPVSNGIWVSTVLSIGVLFAVGAVKAHLTVGNWIKSGIEVAAVGTAAALLGYLIGKVLAVTPIV